MTTITWIIIAYLFTVVISWKPIHKAVKHPKIIEAITPFAPEFIAYVTCFIPVINLYLTYHYYDMLRKEKRFNDAVKRGVFVNGARVLDELCERGGVTEEQKAEWKN